MIYVDVEKFEKTELEHKLDKEFGFGERTIYDNIGKTYQKYILKYGIEEIGVITDEVEPQVYKYGSLEIKVVNKHPSKEINGPIKIWHIDHRVIDHDKYKIIKRDKNMQYVARHRCKDDQECPEGYKCNDGIIEHNFLSR